MPPEIDLSLGARKIVETCMGTRKGEKLLIVTDTGISPRIAEALAEAGRAAGAQVAVITTSPAGGPGEEPAQMTAAAMAEADIILAPTTFSVYHSHAARTATEKGARLLALTELNETSMTRGGIEADFPALQERVNRVAGLFATGREVRVTSPGGTDLSLSIEGRAPCDCRGICREPGEKMGFPDIEVFIAPVENKTFGRLVVDASASGLGLIDQPVTLHFDGGVAREIQGGEQAARLKKTLENSGSPGSFVLSEFALGLNDKSRVTGNIIEDEGTYGTGHFALGSNIFFGGENEAPLHLDMVYWKPTVEIDGEIIMRDGILINE